MSQKNLAVVVAVALSTSLSYAAPAKKRKPSSTTQQTQKKVEKKPVQAAETADGEKLQDLDSQTKSPSSSFGVAAHGGLILEGGGVTMKSPYTLSNPTSNIGVYAGIFADYSFTSSIGMKLGAFYQSNSYTETITVSLGALGSSVATATFNQSWLNIPVFGTYTLFDWWKLGLGGYVGLGLSMNSTSVVTGLGAGTQTTAGFALNFMNSFDAGAAVLSELIFPMSSNMSVVFDGIFEYSFVNGVTSTNVYITTYSRYLINSTLGVRFGF